MNKSGSRSKSYWQTLRPVVGMIVVALAGVAAVIWLSRFQQHNAAQPTLSPTPTVAADQNTLLSDQVAEFYDDYIAIVRQGLESGLNNSQAGSIQLVEQLEAYVRSSDFVSAGLKRQINHRGQINPVLCSQSYSTETVVADRAAIKGSTATVTVHQQDGPQGDFEQKMRVSLTKLGSGWAISAISCL